MMENKKYTFKELLNSVETIRIPKVQRDYAQGRNDIKNSSMYDDIRKGFIASIKAALLQNDEVIFDYIYGAIDEYNNFCPIDGQQRLTLLFLLHWYIAGKEGRLDEARNALGKFTYDIRDTTREFCSSLLDMDVSFEDGSEDESKDESEDGSEDESISICDQIKNSKQYFNAFNQDASISSMLKMLESIDETFKGEGKESNLWDKLDNIKFWVLPLENYGLSDDIFVKMNARGKRLHRFDVFKSDLESKLDSEYPDNPFVDLWKKEIDNSYLDSYYEEFDKNNLERNVYRTILFFVKLLGGKRTDEGLFDDSWETCDQICSYSDVIETICSDIKNLNRVCKVLENYKYWKKSDESAYLMIPKEADKDYVPEQKIRGDKKVKLFGILYWYSDDRLSCRGEDDFLRFKRILSNYVFSRRQSDNKLRTFRSSIDNKSLLDEISFIKELLDEYSDSCTDSFYDFVLQDDRPALSIERIKLSYESLDEIVKLEQVPQLSTIIGNFFFDEKVFLGAESVEEILGTEELKNKALRIILSFADDKYGKFQNLVFDAITKQSGSRQLEYNSPEDVATSYCHKFFISEKNNTEYGDKILSARADGRTEQEADISKAVRQFVKGMSQYIQEGTGIPEALDLFLEKRIGSLVFDNESENILPYIVKYSEFFYKPDYTTLLTLRRKNYDTFIDDDCVFDIRCINKDYNLTTEEHYQPFYKALNNCLKRLNSTVSIVSGIGFTGSQIEYANPCTLSDGRVIRIWHKGQWTINGELVQLGNGDCIEEMANYLNQS